MIGAAPLAPCAPPDGLTETTFSGATGAATFALVVVTG